ncbi:period circadian regulator isoform X2 [Brevipalpus obovatus]|uniref:period circadian regulator isoform X2 n=1 Tax=Brevipalpus obovatus TaxID=246614 RepID=UPI003D9F2D21
MYGQFSSGLSSSNISSTNKQESFCFTVSLHDATTLHVTNRITMVLGYPEDMLKGQCILNYLYPRDRLTFASHLSQGLQSRFTPKDSKSEDKIVFYVRIREYKGLKGGYGVAERPAVYRPFQLTCVVKDITLDKQDNPKPANEEISTICLIASASPINSAHKVSNEKNPAMTPFSSRHTSSCHYSHIDTSSIPYLGYLPQDIVGYSVFDFYHQDDLHLLRDIYELVIREEGALFRSKPYRFRVFNGDYITLETDWSSFINPWSRSMEFVIGHHRIIDGPTNPNVFSEPEAKRGNVGNGEGQRLQEEVRNLLSKPIKHNYGKTRGNKRKRNLATFVSNIIDGIGLTSIRGQECYSDEESVVMGEISPHQDDSDPSPETPSSSQQTQLQENIERFFASQPKTNCSPSSSSNHSNSTTQNNSPYGSGSNDDSLNHQQTYTNSMDSGINANSFDSSKKGGQTNKSGNEYSMGEKDVGKNSQEKVGGNQISNNMVKYSDHNNRKSRNFATTNDGSPINTNCVSLTEESLSHHNKIISKRMHKQSSHQISSKNINKMESTKFKRSHATNDPTNHTKPKQACYHPDNSHRDHHFGQRQTIPNISTRNATMERLNLDSSLPFGMPVLLNQSFAACDLSSTNLRRNSHSSSTPHLLMPVMYVASPMALCPSNEPGSGGRGAGQGMAQFYQQLNKKKKNVKLQTDLWTNLHDLTPRRVITARPVGGSNFVSKLFASRLEQERSGRTSVGCSQGCSSSLNSDETSQSDYLSNEMSRTSYDSESSAIDSSDTQGSAMKFQIPLTSLDFTLKKDLALLENMNQPNQVKDQLFVLCEEAGLAEKNFQEAQNGKSLKELASFDALVEDATDAHDYLAHDD